MKKISLLCFALLLVAAYPREAQARGGLWAGLFVAAVATAVVIAYCEHGHPIYHGHSVCSHRHGARTVVAVYNPPGHGHTTVVNRLGPGRVTVYNRHPARRHFWRRHR